MTRIKLDIISKLRLKDDGVKILSALFIIFTIILCIKILDLLHYEYEWLPLLLGFVVLIITVPLGLIKTIFLLKISRKEDNKHIGYKAILKAFQIIALSRIIISLGYICFIIPGVIFSYIYSQVYYILCDNPDIGVIECLSKSREIMTKEK